MRALYRKWFPKYSCPKCRDTLDCSPGVWCSCPAAVEAEKKADYRYWELMDRQKKAREAWLKKEQELRDAENAPKP